MKVKLLLFPLSIVLALALSVFWTQPEISSALSLRNQKSVVVARLLEADRVIANINALDQSLSSDGNKQFVEIYLPKAESDDRIIDQVNFLAGGSGLLLVSAGLEPVPSEIVQVATQQVQAATDQAELAAASPESLVNTGMPGGTDMVFTSSSPKLRVRSTDVSVSVFGKYDQIKAFIDRVYHANRFQRFVSVDVVQSTEGKTTTDTSSMAPDMLNATLVIRFSVLPETVVSPGTLLDTFNTSKFNLAVVSDLRGRVTAELPILDAVPSERSNPFLR